MIAEIVHFSKRVYCLFSDYSYLLNNILGLMVIEDVINYIFWCVITTFQHCITKNCRISSKGPPQSFIQYFVVPDHISNIGYSRISGNKWHVKYALSFIILQEYTRWSTAKWRSLQCQLDMCSETWMPRQQQSQNMANIYKSYILTPRGARDVSEGWGSNRWTYSPSLFTVSSPISKL